MTYHFKGWFPFQYMAEDGFLGALDVDVHLHMRRQDAHVTVELSTFILDKDKYVESDTGQYV